jgi:hypothetical protein
LQAFQEGFSIEWLEVPRICPTSGKLPKPLPPNENQSWNLAKTNLKSFSQKTMKM